MWVFEQMTTARLESVRLQAQRRGAVPTATGARRAQRANVELRASEKSSHIIASSGERESQSKA